METEPEFGTPEWEKEYGKIHDCIGCGFCCFKTKCGVAMRLWPDADHCPSLIWSESDERHYCELMLINGKLGEGYREQLYAGAGCCSNLNSWRYEPLKDRTQKGRSKKALQDDLKNPIPPVMQKFLLSLGHQMLTSDIIFLAMSEFKQRLLNDNMPKKDVDKIINFCFSCLQNQKSKFDIDFMG